MELLERIKIEVEGVAPWLGAELRPKAIVSVTMTSEKDVGFPPPANLG